MPCCKRKEAVKVLMNARARGIVWKLVLQIVMDQPSALVNAWREIDRSPEPCPVKVWQCNECQAFVAAIGQDGRCGRCNPSANF